MKSLSIRTTMALLSDSLAGVRFSSVSHRHRAVPSRSSSVIPVSEDDVVDAAVSVLKHHRSKSRWSYLRSLLTSLPENRLTPSQFSQIAVQIRNNPHLAYGFFDFTLRNSLSAHSISSYSTIIHILSRGRMKSKALNVIKSAMRTFSEEQKTPTPIALLESLIRSYRDCDSAPFVFDLLVQACVESKKMDLAIEIYALLRSKHVSLRTSTCNSLIELVSKSRGALAGYNLCLDMFTSDDDGNANRSRPNSDTLNVVMVGFYREGLIEKVEQVWDEFRLKGCEPNIYSFNVLMSAYCDEGRMDGAMKIWEEINRNKNFTPDSVSYTTIITAFCRIGEIEKAEEIYREMAMKGVEPTCATFDHLIRAYCRKGDTESAMALYKDMLRRGFSPENSTVNAIVTAHCGIGNEGCEEALRILRVAEKRGGNIVLDAESYTVLIRSLCERGFVEESLKLQREMVAKCGHEPCAEIYEAFIDGYERLGNEEMVMRLRDEMACRSAEKLQNGVI